MARKRICTPETWKRNKRKAHRNLGMPYETEKGKLIRGRKTHRPNCEKCRFKCSTKISEDKQKELFDIYWGFGDYIRQRSFVCKHVNQTASKQGKRREISNSYFLPVDGSSQRVCKKFFLATFDIDKKVIECSLKKKEHGEYTGRDERGKTQSGNKLKNETRSFINQHIESFPTVESHYTRKDTQRKYLSPDLNITQMYRLYKEECQKKGFKLASISTYRKVFCENYNLSFFKPKNDQCSMCNLFQTKQKEGTLTDQETDIYNIHQYLKDAAREQKAADKIRAQTDPTFTAYTFDLEKVLTTPCSLIGELYYKRKLCVYNLSFFSLKDRQGICYLWDETHGKRGSCEIGSCMLKHVQSAIEGKSPPIREIVFYSDSCGGQNRNQFVAAALLCALNQNAHIEMITHKFFERGHSEMEADSIHAAVERAKKNTKIYLPSQWDTVISMARKSKSYIVVPLMYPDFWDLKKLRKETCTNMKLDITGEKINWLNVKQVQVRKGNPKSIFVNYSFDIEAFKEIRVKSPRGRTSSEVSLQVLYKEKIPISSAKKNDLISLCDSGVIPVQYRWYYQNLPSKSTVKDKLPEPDILENDVDTDED